MDTVEQVVARYLEKGEAGARTYEVAVEAVHYLRANGHPEAEWDILGRFGTYVIYNSEQSR